ncbi:MAG: hypothetical protein ACYTGZ_01675 [Planctomycetota bacterium]|jgi:hypothetical protein
MRAMPAFLFAALVGACAAPGAGPAGSSPGDPEPKPTRADGRVAIGARIELLGST